MNINNFKQLCPVFVLGIARSGTTLLQSLLDGHPQLLVDIADSRFVYWYKRHYRGGRKLRSIFLSLEQRILAAEGIMIQHVFNEASQYYQDFLSHVSIDALKNNFRSLVKESAAQPKDFMESYFHALGLTSGHLSAQTCYWVDKTLSYEYLFYRYAQWWPNARFIYMVRDPRDIYTSYKKRDIKNNRPVTSIESFAVTWGNTVHALLGCKRIIIPKNHFILKYEDLINNPKEVMQLIAQFLGIEFQPGLLAPTKGFGHISWGGNPETGKRQPGVIYKDALRKWDEYLQPSEIAKLEFLLGREMEAVGYSLSAPRQSYPLASANVWARRSFLDFLNFGL